MHWEELFSQRVLERGYSYWARGAVTLIAHTEGQVKAIVRGSEKYFVEISRDAQRSVVSLGCDCPHAADGNNCKHMAAVLYELDSAEDSQNERNAATQTATLSIEAAVAALDIDQLRAELLRAAQNDGLLAAQIIARSASYAAKNSSETNERDWESYRMAMKRAIQLAIENNSNHGFVDWQQGSGLVYALDDGIVSNLMATVEDSSEVKVPWELSLFLLNAVSVIDIDGSGGEHGEIEELLATLWETIYENASEELRSQMFSELLAYYEQALAGEWFFSDFAWDFLCDHFDSAPLNQRKLQLVDSQLAALEEEIAAAEKAAQPKRRGAATIQARISSYANTYELARLVLVRIQLMKKTGTNHDEIVAFRNRYRFMHQIRKLEIEELQAAGQLDELIALLKESKELDADSRGLVAGYSEQLIECFEALGQHAAARDEAIAFATQYQPGNLLGFKRLKRYYSADEWFIVRETFFNAILEHGRNLNELYKEEGLYERIIATLAQNKRRHMAFGQPPLAELAKYEDVLRPTYDKELLTMYRETVIEMARPTTGREGYRKIVSVLRRMLAYPAGEAIVRELTDQWRSTYRNRSAMQDELNQVFRPRHNS